MRQKIQDDIEATGFIAPAEHTLGEERRSVAVASLIATAALAISTIVAATVVSVGMARADVASNVIDNEGSLFVIALVLGVLFIGISGLTFMSKPHKRKHRHDHTPHHPTHA